MLKKSNKHSEQIFENHIDKRMFDGYNTTIKNKCSQNKYSGGFKMRSEKAQQRKYKRERARRTRQIIERVLLTICIIALLAIGSNALFSKATTTEEANEIYYTYYTELEIMEGDSLWKIAGEYMENGPYESRNDYINEVIEINQLSSTNIIKGQYLVIPYYDAEYK